LTSPPPCDILISKEAQAMTKIDLITGILGSGKTTFLMKYARHLIDSGQKIAILENDFGAVNIDMMILQELRCDSCQLEMIAGGLRCGLPQAPLQNSAHIPWYAAH